MSVSSLLQHIIRKERAVGLIPGAPTIYEVLEELAITVQQQLVDAPLPFCAFNGGGDVFVDVGNKSLGLEALMQYLKFNPSQVCSVAVLEGCHATFTTFSTLSCSPEIFTSRPAVISVLMQTSTDEV